MTRPPATVPRPEPPPAPAHSSSAGPVLVVGYDGSPRSVTALRWAARHAQHDGRVIVTFAGQPVPGRLSPRWQDVLREDDRRAAAAVFDEMLADSPPLGCDWETEVESADSAAEALVAVARRHRADAIVVGAHGYGPVSGALGSVSRRLVRISPVAVVVLGPEVAES